ncbi:MAG: N-acetylmuramoyl-L-alanine amidase [Dysgonamonadaceae bacterium]|jgi:N-acetylmuramoyl-L-alanine amidase|nr:N-acetylmuramoyl-L-alanine amidase [Dysgonamonadaceae bacterium]
MNKLIILDNGHGKDTAGKRSPVWTDGSQLFEYEFNRDIVSRISFMLTKEEIKHSILVPEEIDISLTERVRRANELSRAWSGNAILISIHANAGGGTGWEVWTSVGKTKSDQYATILFNEAKKMFPEWKMRSDTSDGDLDKESNFTILAKTTCPAVLTENFFMDTEKDCRFIMSESGRDKIAKMHVSAIKKMVEME